MTRELVVQAISGDRAAFAELAARDLARVTGAAQLILRDRAWAEDAAQETFVRVWRDLPSLRDPDRYGGWLYRILVRTCQDELRRKQRQPRWIALETETLSGPDHVNATADRDELEHALQRLSPEHRVLIVLAYYVDLSHPEIAASLGIPLGTVKSRLNRALANLRVELSAGDRTAPAREQLA